MAQCVVESRFKTLTSKNTVTVRRCFSISLEEGISILFIYKCRPRNTMHIGQKNDFHFRSWRLFQFSQIFSFPPSHCITDTNVFSGPTKVIRDQPTYLALLRIRTALCKSTLSIFLSFLFGSLVSGIDGCASVTINKYWSVQWVLC